MSFTRHRLTKANRKVKSFLFWQERAAQARITDLESQLSRATASAAQLKRSKEEVSWHYFQLACRDSALFGLYLLHFVWFDLTEEPHFPWLCQISIRTLLSILIKLFNRIIYLVIVVSVKMCFAIQKKWLNVLKRAILNRSHSKVMFSIPPCKM